ncbi:MAG: N-acetylmuramoyl-L-alanine amidase [Paenibacillaceae bacterium]|nr:N-acetylmuramoyl-L-alanine amidase [Paenibacillaceae bacterium]
MKKLVFALFTVVCLLIALPNVSSADDAVQLFLNGKRLQPEAPPRNVDGNIIVPVRLVTQELGAKVSWDDKERKVTLVKEDTTIQLYIGRTDAYVGKVKHVLDVAPVIENDVTLVPVRFVSQEFGLKVSWDDLTKSVSLFRQAVELPSVSPPAASVSPSPSAEPTPKPTLSPSATPKPGASGSPSSTPTPASSKSPSPGASVSPGQSPAPGKLAQVQSIKTTADQIIVQLSETITPNFFYLSNPDRLVIDLPYAELSPALTELKKGNEGEVASVHPDVAKLRYATFSNEPPTIRVVVDLNKKIDYNLVDSKKPGELIISLKQARYKVVLDAGHGDGDSGAVSVTKKLEKNFNLAMVTKIAAILEKESLIDLKLTRSDDTFVELDDRVKIANDWNATLFVSVHGNKYNSNIRGVETYYTRSDSLALAKLMHGKIVAASGNPDRGVRTADFRVTKNTNMPAILCEIGYLSNPAEEAMMFTEAFQNKVAAAIAQGIKEYLHIP